jgi:hypothetical protein
MQFLGLISILIVVLLGVTMLVNSSTVSNSSEPNSESFRYKEAIDAARAIPGAPAANEDK